MSAAVRAEKHIQEGGSCYRGGEMLGYEDAGLGVGVLKVWVQFGEGVGGGEGERLGAG